jgi:hypothetical protein
MNASMEIGCCLYWAGVSMLLTGILLFVLIVIMKDNRRKPDWYYLDVSKWEAFKRRTGNFFVSLFWFLGIVTGIIGFYFGSLGPYPTESKMLFSGMTICYISMFIRSLKILFEKYITYEEYQIQKLLAQQTKGKVQTK